MAHAVLELNGVPVGENHRYIHGGNGEYKVKERVAVQRSKSLVVFVIDVAIHLIIVIVLVQDRARQSTRIKSQTVPG